VLPPNSRLEEDYVLPVMWLTEMTM
jgi:hypothetical protein